MALDINAIIIALITAAPSTLVAALALRRGSEVKTIVQSVKADVAEVKVSQKKQREDLATTLNGALKN